MKVAVIFVVALFGAASAGYSGGNDDDGSYGSRYNSAGGAGLRSIAQGSADQANSAVAQQHAAARQASYTAKVTLAQAAVQAAATAQAALAGKKVLKENILDQRQEARDAYQKEVEQLQIAKQSAETADALAQQALSHVNALAIVKNTAERALRQAETAANAVSSVLSAQSDGSTLGGTRLQEYEAQLEAVRADYAETQAAADRATSSAQQARENADAAQAQATYELQSVSAAAAGTGHGSYEESYGSSYDENTHHKQY